VSGRPVVRISGAAGPPLMLTESRSMTTSSAPALFDPIAGLYQRYAEITDGVFRPWLDRNLPAHADRAADLGCGSGRWSVLLADRATDVLAVDISDIELSLARTSRARANVSYERRSLLDVTTARDGLFDLVVSVNTLFHLHGEHGVDPVLAHVRSLVAPGGRALLVDVVSPGPRSPLHHRWWGVTDAARTLGRGRSVADAWAVFRLRQHPTWMRHARTNHPLTRPRFHDAYSRHFPGAIFTDDLDPFTCAASWQAPMRH
jgi:SAM-dependent methyltransferase